MPDKEQSIGAAVVAASEKDYVGFKDAVTPEIEDRMKTAISAKAQSARESMFNKIGKSTAADLGED